MNATSRPFLEMSTALLERGYQIRFRAHGHSMAPTIRPDDVLLVDPVADRDVRVGDILLYRHGSGALAHRVVSIKRESRRATGFVLRGDALDACDAPITPDCILGRVVALERGGRSVALTGVRARIRQSARLTASRLRRRLRP